MRVGYVFEHGIKAPLLEHIWKSLTLWLGGRLILCANKKLSGWVKRQKN